MSGVSFLLYLHCTVCSSVFLVIPHSLQNIRLAQKVYCERTCGEEGGGDSRRWFVHLKSMDNKSHRLPYPHVNAEGAQRTRVERVLQENFYALWFEPAPKGADWCKTAYWARWLAIRIIPSPKIRMYASILNSRTHPF